MNETLFEYLQTYLTERRKQLIWEISAMRTRHFTVVTEDVYQMHNTSAVMRTCDVFGIQDLHVIDEAIGKRIDKEIAMGAQKWVDVFRYRSTDDCIKKLKKSGYKIVATTPHEKSHTLDTFDIGQKSAFFFGKESEGLSDKVLEQADTSVYIPMYGFTESLNVSVSVAIILQFVVSKMKKNDISWQFSEEELEQLRFQWTKKCIKNADEISTRFLKDNS